MKLVSLPSIVLIISLAFQFGCGSDDKDPQTPVGKIHLTTGFLCTIGVNSSGKSDTICFRFSNSGTNYSLTDFQSDSEEKGFIERPRDIVTLTLHEPDKFILKNNGGGYISIDESDYFEDDDYFETTHHTEIKDASMFVVNAEDDGQFYIESVMQKNYYLNTIAYPDDPEHEIIRFVRNKQKWFFLP